MKLRLIILLTIVSLSVFSQPVSGYLGKKLFSSIEMEIVPGFQEYEANQSGFLSFWSDSYSYTPRFFINTDYQFKPNLAVSGGLGWSHLQVPFYLYNFNYSETLIRPMNTVHVQLRLKKGTNGNMPTSSSYIAYGIGLYFLSMPSVPLAVSSGDDIIFQGVTDANATNFAVNVEFGRRVVFSHGIVLDFGIVTNLSTGLLKFGSYDDYSNELSEEYVKNQMLARSAINSLFNFKIGIGLFY